MRSPFKVEGENQRTPKGGYPYGRPPLLLFVKLYDILSVALHKTAGG